MSADFVQLATEALALVLVLSLPVVGAALGVGLVVGILSTATQVQEQSLTYAPKLVAITLVLALTGTWMLGQIVGFTDGLWQAIPDLVR